MQTHKDGDFKKIEWFEELKQAADAAKSRGDGIITAGNQGEPEIDSWEHKQMTVVQRPNDPHGILRISVGGSDQPLPLEYLTFRGDRQKCLALLRKAVVALESR